MQYLQENNSKLKNIIAFLMRIFLYYVDCINKRCKYE